ncbi:NHL repeat-containing protein [Lichenicoccus roseus]|uniref:hypothetical protein n=1 Tax=Lichenicoccus roseus TaxID=2683649 RepID=UPI001F1124F0|nr:hypothetical protein [Lichenicoccus roseus]
MGIIRKRLQRSRRAFVVAIALLACTQSLVAHALEADSVLGHLHHHHLLTTTVPRNGDQNPYGIAVAPVSAGSIHRNDVLISNFNNSKNLQGLGTTIVAYHPDSGSLSTFATLPRHLPAGGPQCPGGVGLTTALTMLSSGYVIVGSLPSEDGTTTTKSQGCLLVLDSAGKLVSSITGAQIDGPWGNMALHEHPGGATLFVSNTGFGVGAADGTPPVVQRATILRIELAFGPGQPPRVTGQTVVADGLGEQADKSVFIIGPTGLALDADGTLYASDALGNRIVAIDDALTRTASAGQGREISRDGLLNRPLALVQAPGGHLLTTNGLNGQVVEIDPKGHRQIGAQWFDSDKAQSPPGSGDLFGIAATPSGDGFYYVEDDVNTLQLAN